MLAIEEASGFLLKALSKREDDRHNDDDAEQKQNAQNYNLRFT